MQLFEFPEEYVLCEVLREKPGRELLLWENTRLHQKILLRCTGLENRVLCVRFLILIFGRFTMYVLPTPRWRCWKNI